MNQPTNLQNVPGYGSYQPPATPPHQTEDTRAVYMPRAVPCLTVQRDGRATLNAEASRQLPGGIAAVELNFPVRERDCWRLTCYPSSRCKLIDDRGRRLFRAPVAARGLFEKEPAETETIHLGMQHVGNGVFHLYRLTVPN